MMRRSRLLFGVLVAAGLVGGCARPVFTSAPVSAERREWTFGASRGAEIVTNRYRVRTTCLQPALLDRVPGFVEGCWDGYAELIPPKRLPAQPAETYLFQMRRDWEAFTKAFSPARAATYLMIRSGGYEERGVTVSHYDRMSTTFPVLAHEGLHQFLTLTRGGILPPWVNEGLACNFEAFDLADDGRPAFTPRRNAIRRANLREALNGNRLFALREILGTNAGRVVGLPSARVRAYYAQVWSLVLFLLESDPKRDAAGLGFRALLGDLGTPAMVARARRVMAGQGGMEFGEAVFRAYVTEDIEGFEQRYLAFCRDLLAVN